MRKSKKKVVQEVAADLTPTDVAKIKAIVYEGKADMCWFTTRDEVKSLIKLAEAYFSVVHDKNHALEHALNRLETIQLFSGKPMFEGVNWESMATQTRIKNALKWKGFEDPEKEK